MTRKPASRETATYWVWQAHAVALPLRAGSSLHRAIRATSKAEAKRIVARSAGVPASALGATRIGN